jgi:GNAT superfamily N-acetyltransferase
MELAPMTSATMRFVYECLGELRGSAVYSFENFSEYVDQQLIEHPACRILVASIDGNPVGMLTCNTFAMPRYLGFGYELEEVVVHPLHRRQGLGRKMIARFIDDVRSDPRVRKIIVKTDDRERAGRLYSGFFDTSDSTVYTLRLNNYRNDG